MYPVRMGKKQVSAAKDSSTKKRDERTMLLLGVFVLLVSLYLLAAFVSYLFTWSADQSLAWQNIFKPLSVRADNLMGPVGATLSAMLITRAFGLAALALPLLLFMYGMRILRFRFRKWVKRQLLFYVGIPLASVVLGFLSGGAGGYLGNGLGGQYGFYIADWLNHFISPVGTALLLALLVLAYLMWFNRRVEERVHAFLNRVATRIKPVAAADGNDTLADQESAPSGPESASVADASSLSETEGEAPRVEPIAQVDEERLPAVRGSLGNDDFVIERPAESPVSTLGSDTPQDAQRDTTELDQPIPPDADGTAEAQPLGLEVESREEELSEVDAFTSNEPYDPTKDLPHYKYPTIDLLDTHDSHAGGVTEAELLTNKDRIVKTLGNFDIEIERIKATVGPTITLYEIVPAPGVRISKIKNLEDDIALNLAALGIRIIAPIPGRGTIGIEVPNAKPTTVSMYSCLRSEKFTNAAYALPIALGKTISNEVYVVDLAKMPHLLVAGATGQGKSVGLNAIITSLLYKKHPSQLKFVLVDPKKVELTLYTALEKHFLAKLPDAEEAIITDTDKVINTLNSLCIEMDTRYSLLKDAKVRSIQEYNDLFVARRLNPNNGHRFLPYIVLVIDEFADLIMTAGREIESPLTRLAQLARAIGIHLVIATQRPTTNIITGTIKANFPTRVAFRVMSSVDSKTILDEPGANQLIGRGDMLINTGNEMVRLQCAFLDTPEVARITSFIGDQRGYDGAFMLPDFDANSEVALGGAADLNDRDPLFEEVAHYIVEEQKCSTSNIQRRYSIGYNRAGRIVDQLELAGIVGKQDASKPRPVLVGDLASLNRLLSQLDA